jgi:hypothetical protein
MPTYRLFSGHAEGTSSAYDARGGWITFFEQMQQLHGFEATLVDLAESRPEIYQLRDDLLQFNLDWLDRWLAHEYQGLHFADDWESQTGLLISPRLWRCGVARSFRPLPKQRTCAPVPRCTSWARRPTSSETRNPVSSARSRKA